MGSEPLSHISSVDVAVVGGGVSGLAVAKSLLAAGWSVALFERDKIGSGTSANSLRIMHGGFRYLQSFDFRRSFKSLSDQKVILQEHPDLVKPIRCVMVLSGKGMKKPLYAAAGATLFSAMKRISGSSLLPSPRVVRRRNIQDAKILHDLPGSDFVLQWYDALLLDPARHMRRIAEDITRQGGFVYESTPVTRIESVGGVATLDTSAGKLSAKVVVRAVGQLYDQIPLVVNGVNVHIPVRSCVSFNLIVRRALVSPDTAIGIDSEEERRLFFMVPRGTGTAIGTWNTVVEGEPRVLESDVQDFISSFARASKGINISPDEIENIEWGVLPREEGVTEPTPQGHERIFRHENCITLISTKYTTFRAQAERVAIVAGRMLRKRL